MMSLLWILSCTVNSQDPLDDYAWRQLSILNNYISEIGANAECEAESGGITPHICILFM